MLKQPKKRFVKSKTLAFNKIPGIKVIYVSIALCLLNLLLILIVQKRLPPEVPLFYGLALGQEQLAKPLELAIPTIFTLFIIIIN